MSEANPTVISAHLRELTAVINEHDPDLVAHGVLGGEDGYGAEYENDVFEMHPFWWGECECGYETREWDWEETHEHAADCYQSVIRARGFGVSFDTGRPYDVQEGINRRIVSQTCAEMGLDPQLGSYVHCTCTYERERRQWLVDNPHPAACPVVRPNFRHKETGFEVRWYKYIGRGMEHEPIDRREWRRIATEAIESVEAGELTDD